MVFCIIPFFVGGPLQTEFCRYMTGRYPDGPRKMDQYVFETLKSLINTADRPIPDSSNNREITITRDLATARATLDIIRFNLSDTILTRCEHEPFVKAISTGEFVWPVLNDVSFIPISLEKTGVYKIYLFFVNIIFHVPKD
ncbi:unnamed protein product [Trichobilharzia regenti]|nr:unnamed protein product [Trichobilharzia regenti]